MGNRQGLREFKFNITEPADGRDSTKVVLDGFRYDSGNEIMEYVDQIHWWPWFYRKRIESAKRKCIERYFRDSKKDRVWTEGIGGKYKNNAEEVLLGDMRD